MRRVTEKSRKTGGRVEAWDAQPVDRSVAPDESGRLRITDQGVIFETHRLCGCVFACWPLRLGVSLARRSTACRTFAMRDLAQGRLSSRETWLAHLRFLVRFTRRVAAFFSARDRPTRIIAASISLMVI